MLHFSLWWYGFYEKKTYSTTKWVIFFWLVTIRETFEHLKFWRNEFLLHSGISKEEADSYPFVVLGNKIDKDSERAVLFFLCFNSKNLIESKPLILKTKSKKQNVDKMKKKFEMWFFHILIIFWFWRLRLDLKKQISEFIDLKIWKNFFLGDISRMWKMVCK